MIQFLFFSIIFYVCGAYATPLQDAYVTQNVRFYPNLTIYYTPSTDVFLQKIYRELAKSSDYLFRPIAGTSPQSSRLLVDYAIGCGAFNPEKTCRLKIWWRLLRKDNAPIAGWVADYPITITQEQAQNRLMGVVIPETMIMQATQDLVMSLSKMP